MTKSTKTSSKGGCGCGGSGKSSTTPSPCGCGGGKHECKCGGQSTCQDSCSGQEFRRPVFFEGQLLTEDDLQALSGYVVQKNRLHMRHFWGDGVVCGLHVKPHPCSPSKLIVEPGYALDCCGNDIVLQCQQELDIRQMVHDLQVAMQDGYDCGDPCPEEKPCGPAAQQTPQNNVSATPPGASPPGVNNTPPPPPRREYCLYVDYCEKGVDPTTAYGTGQQCGSPACYPMRILEGLRFELRCRPKEAAPDDFSTRYCQCRQKQLKDPADAARINAISRVNNAFGAALANEKAGDFAFAKAEYVTATKAVAAQAQTPIEDDAALDTAFDAATVLLKQSARYYTLPQDQRKALNVTNPQLTAGAAALAKVVDALNQPKAKELLAARPAFARDYYTALAERAAEIAKFTEESTLPETEKSLMQGVVVNDSVIKAFTTELDVVGSRLGLEISPAPAIANTSGFATAAPHLELRSFPALSNVNLLQSAVDRANLMVNNVQNSKIDCICDNINPPCLPCVDQGVLLACFAWDQCEVTHLCELVRKFVLTPNNLRYWIPAIGQIGELVEELCCCRENWREILSSRGGSPLALELLLGAANATCETRATGNLVASSYMLSKAPAENLYYAAADLLPRSSFAPATETAPETTIVLRALDQLLEDETFRKNLRERLKA